MHALEQRRRRLAYRNVPVSMAVCGMFDGELCVYNRSDAMASGVIRLDGVWR